MKNAVSEFEKLLEISGHLMGPEGCPWDREQTLVSMRNSVLEEACEVIEAIDEDNKENLVEELGDLLYNVLFFCQLGEKEKRFTLEEVIGTIREKLIRRHPHVFQKESLKDVEQIINQWERIKKEEKKERESLLDGIPKGLPALARASKMIHKMKKKIELSKQLPEFNSEEELGEILFQLSVVAESQGLHPEHALRKELLNQEKTFRQEEKTH